MMCTLFCFSFSRGHILPLQRCWSLPCNHGLNFWRGMNVKTAISRSVNSPLKTNQININYSSSNTTISRSVSSLLKINKINQSNQCQQQSSNINSSRSDDGNSNRCNHATQHGHRAINSSSSSHIYNYSKQQQDLQQQQQQRHLQTGNSCRIGNSNTKQNSRIRNRTNKTTGRQQLELMQQDQHHRQPLWQQRQHKTATTVPPSHAATATATTATTQRHKQLLIPSTMT